MRAVRFHRHGPPDVLSVDEVPLPLPGPGEARVRIEAAGVNFIDTYLRSGYYPVPELPALAGKEGAGVVEAVGPGVEDVGVGDRVAFWDASGAYAEAVVRPAARLVPVPEGVSSRLAAAALLQGLTAHYLLRTIHVARPGHRILIHAAAGGVGHLAVQIAQRFGARVAGTCSTREKAERLRELGVERVIVTSETDFVREVEKWTEGRGVDATLDGVGRATFERSVAATRVRGHVILFGQASGEPDPIRPRRLLGSRTLTCASLFDYAADRSEMLVRAEELFEWIADGSVEVAVGEEHPLEDARLAHERLEGRATAGKVLLVP